MQNENATVEVDELIDDHTALMYANPENYGYSSEYELSGLTRLEMERGTTKDHMLAYGEWLLTHAIRNLRRPSFSR